MHLRRNLMALGLAALMLVTTAANFAVAESWLFVTTAGELVSDDAIAPQPTDVSVRDFGQSGFEATVRTPGLTAEEYSTEYGEFVRLRMPERPVAGEIGAPAIPVVRELFVAPMGATVTVEADAISDSLAVGRTPGMQVRLEPNQPPIPKEPGALESAPFVYDAAAYALRGDSAPLRATVSELGIVRGQRLMLLEVWPVSYEPASQRLSLHQEIVATVRFEGGDARGSDLSPMPGLSRIVLNPSMVPARRWPRFGQLPDRRGADVRVKHHRVCQRQGSAGLHGPDLYRSQRHQQLGDQDGHPVVLR